MESDADVVVVQSNVRITMPVLLHPKVRNTALGKWRDQPYLHAHIWRHLFKPSALLQNRTNHWSKHRGEERLIGIHFRTGNYSARWVDPSRHEVGQLVAFLECARQVEKMLQFPANKTRWFLAADAPLEIPEEFAGKVFGPADPETNELNNIVHLDRSQIGDLVVGLVDAWAQWLLLASSDAVILSESVEYVGPNHERKLYEPGSI
eukprot:GEMP01028416.1.p1 GENE.GEMP01028416.1~~GEMP01028416.1.p1  ORF type:complete len:206 (+),score=36.59 GEMP01028416.1:571-1188(+)